MEKTVNVKTWTVDLNNSNLNNSKSLKVALEEVQLFGQVECVLFNAAAVRTSQLLEEPEEGIERDFRVRSSGWNLFSLLTCGTDYKYSTLQHCMLGYPSSH